MRNQAMDTVKAILVPVRPQQVSGLSGGTHASGGQSGAWPKVGNTLQDLDYA